MLTVTFRKKTAPQMWETIPTPPKLSEMMALAAECVGKEVIIKIETTKTECYLCGTEELVQLMKDMKKKSIVMTLEEAHRQLEEMPEVFCVCIQIFSTKEHLDRVFPPKPVQQAVQQEIPKSGWEHLRPGTEE
jgi:hypothetical protein